MGLIKTQEEMAIIRESGRRLAHALNQVRQAVVPGVKTAELNNLAEKVIREGGDEPSFLHYQPEGAVRPYPATLCVSVNDEIVHGIPTDRVLKEGDIVGIDLGLEHKGYHTDMAYTVAVGKVDILAQKLMDTTKEAMMAAISVARPGGRLGDIGAAIEEVVLPNHFNIVRELGGHGIGQQIHEEPFIANFGRKGKGGKIQAGMVLAIEPILTEGSAETFLASDGYTFKTRDGKRAAHFEHTVIITENGPEIVTQT